MLLLKSIKFRRGYSFWSGYFHCFQTGQHELWRSFIIFSGATLQKENLEQAQWSEEEICVFWLDRLKYNSSIWLWV